MLYVTDGIILRKHEVKNSQWILTILTREYGKIRWFTKIQTKGWNFDIGHFVEFHIQRKNETNNFSSLRTKIAVWVEGANFEILFGFMQIVSCIDRQIPENASDSAVYEDLLFLVSNQREKWLLLSTLRLIELRLLLIFQQELFLKTSPTVPERVLLLAKKLEAIGRNHTLEELLRIHWIPTETLELLHIEFLRNFFPWQ